MKDTATNAPTAVDRATFQDRLDRLRRSRLEAGRSDDLAVGPPGNDRGETQ